MKMPLILDGTPIAAIINKWLFTESVHRIRLMNGTSRSLVYIRPENIYEDKLLDASIKELNLSIRAFNCLWRDGYEKIGDVSLLSKKQIRSIRQMGNYSTESIMEEMKNIGYPLKE
jgi:DNA-directed RNA polymerase subunit alpha